MLCQSISEIHKNHAPIYTQKQNIRRYFRLLITWQTAETIQGVEKSTDFVMLKVSLRNSIQKTDCMFIVLSDVSLVWQSFVKNAKQIYTHQTIKFLAKFQSQLINTRDQFVDYISSFLQN